MDALTKIGTGARLVAKTLLGSACFTKYGNNSYMEKDNLITIMVPTRSIMLGPVLTDRRGITIVHIRRAAAACQ